MNRKTKSVLILIGAILVLITLVIPKIGSLRETSKNNTASVPRDQRLPVRTQVIRTQKLGDKVITVGTILSNEEVEIRSEVSGKITRIFFEEGGRVRRGETLLKMNDAELQAQLVRAQHRPALAELQERRQQQLLEKNLTSQEDYDNAVNELKIMQDEVRLIHAQIDKTEIRAPFDGVIGLRYVSEGSYISPATRIATLQDNSVVKIDFTIPEKYAGLVKSGDTFNFTIHSSLRQLRGTIYAIESKIDPATRTLHLRGLSPNLDGSLLPGAFTNVEIVLPEKNALMIPAEALIPELKGHKVFLCKDGKAVSQSVKIGARTDKYVEITQGVQAGDTLITSAILQLRPGMAVQMMQNR